MTFVRYAALAPIAALGLLLILAAPASEPARADGHGFGGVGVVLVFDGEAANDGLIYVIRGATIPREGEAYEGWLVDSASGERLSTGVMEVGEDGAITHRFLTPDGSGVLAWDTVEITREPAPDDDPGPGETVYSYTHAAALLDEVRHLIERGASPGDLTVLFFGLVEAGELAAEAMAATTLDAFRASAGALLAVEERLLLEPVAIHAELLTGAHGLAIDVMAGLVDGSSATAEGWMLRARERTRAALAADSLEAGKDALDGTVADLTSARSAALSSYGWARNIATFHVPAIPEAEFSGVLPFAETNATIKEELTAANPFGGFGRILVRGAGSGSLRYDISGVALPREDEAYEGWLVNSATGERLSTGVMEIGEGYLGHVYETEGGANILDLPYDTVEITREPVPDADPGPGVTVYSYTQPPALLAEVRRLIGGGAGRSGDLETLQADLAEAIGLADEAMAAETLDAFRASVRALLALDERLLLEEATVLDVLASGPHAPRINLEIAMAERHTANAEARTARVRGQAEAALAADSLEAGKAALGGAAGQLRSALGAVGESIEWTQTLMSFHAPSPPPAAAELPTPPADGNAGLAADRGEAGWRWAALIAALGATAAAAAHARRDAGRRRAA